MNIPNVLVYSGMEWVHVPELDAGETIVFQNEYGQLHTEVKSQFISKYEGKFPWWLVAAGLVALVSL